MRKSVKYIYLLCVFIRGVRIQRVFAFSLNNYENIRKYLANTSYKNGATYNLISQFE